MLLLFSPMDNITVNWRRRNIVKDNAHECCTIRDSVAVFESLTHYSIVDLASYTLLNTVYSAVTEEVSFRCDTIFVEKLTSKFIVHCPQGHENE